MAEENKEITEDIVTGTNVQASSEKGIDYDKLIDKFGCSRMTPELIAKIEKITGEPAHRFIRRGMFFCHRELDLCLDCYEKKQPFYLYTGRGPSADALHMGHAIPFVFTQYLQRVFDVPLVIQITDDEKFLFKDNFDLDKTIEMGKSNIKDVLAFGFDPEKTFIFSDTEYIKTLYPNVLKVQKNITLNQMQGIFGFGQSDNVGQYAFPAVQAVPAFSNSFPHIFGNDNIQCLIPAAIDQDPYFRMTRDIASKIHYKKPASLYSSFFSGLAGKKSKMSSSEKTPNIELIDKPKQIKDKINKYALSGGRATVEEHRKLGADLEVDVPYEYLRFWLEDDEKLADIKEKYSKGELLTGEVKAILVEVLQKFIADFQEKRAKITDDDVKHFMSIRKIYPYPKAWKEEKDKEEADRIAAAESKAKADAEAKEAKDKEEAEKKAAKKIKDAEKKKAAVEFAKKKKEEEEKKKAAEGEKQ